LTTPSQFADSPDRETFLAEFGSGGKYQDTVGIYRENESSEKIGIFDEALINGLPSSVKWIAHNGAGYDPSRCTCLQSPSKLRSYFSIIQFNF